MEPDQTHSIDNHIVPEKCRLVSKQTSWKVDGTVLTPKTTMNEKCLRQAQQRKNHDGESATGAQRALPTVTAGRPAAETRCPRTQTG